jgi:hypothetical protein
VAGTFSPAVRETDDMANRGEQAEASQLMDIAAMAAAMQPQPRSELPPPRVELAPSLAASRLTTPTARRSLATRDPRAPIYWMIACLDVVVLALAAYIVFEEPPAVVRHPSVEAPSVEPAVAAPPPAEAPVVSVVSLPELPEASVVEPPKEPEAKRVSSHRKRSRARPREARPPAPAPRKPEPASHALTVECIVDPASCNRGRAAPKAEAQGPRAHPPADDLPQTLSLSALRAGFGRVRGSAKACGPRHGAAPGESVAVKVSIAGHTGVVTSANAVGSHAGTALGKCVASALRAARFERFAKSQIGVQYKVRL